MNDQLELAETRLGFDTHADVSCTGSDAEVLEVIEGKTSIVQPFNDSYNSMKGVKTVNVAFAHDTQDQGTYILIMNQSLDFVKSMKHSILCTKQSRAHGVFINDVPSIFDSKNDKAQTICFKEQGVTLDLEMIGPVPFLNIRKPTKQELEECMWLE